MGVAKGKTRPYLSLSTVQRYDIKNWPRPYLSVFVRLCVKNLFFLIFLDFLNFMPQNICKILAKLPKNDYLCNVASSCVRVKM